MSETAAEQGQKVNMRRLAVPVLIGIGVSLYLIIGNFDPRALENIRLTPKLVTGLGLALVALLVRDFAFMYKIRLSTGEKLSWLKTVQTIIMWEFGAAITPKLGEVAFTLYVLKRSGLSYGRSMAAILLNTFLDNVFFVIAFAVLYGMLGPQMLAVSADCSSLEGHRVMTAVRTLASEAWIGYAIICAAAIFFGVALFWLPHTTKRFFHKLSRLRWLSRLSSSLVHFGDEIEITAYEYKNREWWFWIRMMIATCFNWAARYLMVNAILYAFSTGPLDMLEIFARQFVLWIFMIIPSTPG
ncbi:MAG TPA: lysylphosphatidylglycerol synthase transmembrane domain-containing protein, partial [Chitinophagales bacterium]|nr:lysylphosphatidylglycerol synthase transmembrane domain-containing protein [Chitinophagales bacterium]